MNLQHHINVLIEKNRIDEALKFINGWIEEHPADAEAFFLRGRMSWRLGDRRSAINDYTHAAELDPNGPAVTALEQTRAIMDFFNPDLLNP